MKRGFQLPFILFFCAVCAGLSAQTASHRSGELLVSLVEGREDADFARRFDPQCSSTKISTLLNIWLLRSNLPEEDLLQWLKRQPEVRMAQYNHLLENRGESLNLLPNDPLFPQQWHHLNDGSSGGVLDADLDSEQAWDITTGGLSPAGDTIVLAVIDGGLQAAHPDLAPNVWINRAEIPGNGLDDDQNGYPDDVRGWNVFTQNDQIQGNSTLHGTPVSAILGASGNNNNGVTGVNWHTKIMFVAASGVESELLAAFDYIRQARKRYNETLGAKGAFVVALNCSWGINNGQPSEAPLWCAAYDEMGAEGILSIAATANQPVDVDVVGDLPTACTSQYLVAVTSLNRSDQKAQNAAWGKTHVDLGGYGHEVYSAASAGGYGSFSGTSFAAPQVAGAVGLLYAAPCPNLIALAKLYPASAAYWVKSLILENITPNPSLQGKTFTDGRLNLYRTLLTYESQCSDCPAPFALKSEMETETTARLSWTNPPAANTVNLRWRKLGAGIWNLVDSVQTAFDLLGLSSCMSFEYEVQSVCEQEEESAWSPPFVFQTTGCCTAPKMVWLESSTSNSAKIAWEASSFNNTYRLRLRETGSPAWQLFEAGENAWEFQNLNPCTPYQMQVQARCEDHLTPYSALFSFKTKGCGACNELEYCAVNAADASEEWIASVHIGNWQFYSGNGGNGYQNFSQTQQNYPQLVSGGEVAVRVSPGFSGSASKEYFRIYLDYNQDGDFEDDNELAFDPGFAFEGDAEGMIQVPEFSLPGLTRIRVMMQYTAANDSPPSPCSNFEFGQVEDYCVELRLDTASTSIPLKNSVGLIRTFPQPASDWVMLELPEVFLSQACSITVVDVTGRAMVHRTAAMPQNSRIYLDTSTWTSGVYAVQVSCDGQLLRGKLIKG
jgi:subtilisin family serine protease